MTSTSASGSGRRADSRSGTSLAEETTTSASGRAETTDVGNSATHITTPTTATTPAVEVRADEDDEVCAICYKGDFTDDNLIVFCEGKCHLGFHQKCYGIESIPPGDEPWLCDWCSVGNITTYSKNLYCCHYKNDKTARTLIINDGRTDPTFVHVHVQCAAWIPTVDTSHIPFTTVVPKLKTTKTKCYFCNSRYGFQVKCEHVDGDTSCDNGFHPMCAMRYKFLEPPTTYNVKYTTHVCPEHTREKLENGPKRRRASDVGTSLLVKRATRRQSALPFSSLRGASRSLLDSQSPSPSMPDDHQSQSKRRAVQPSESMDDEAVDSGTSPMQDGSYTPSSGGLDGSRRKNIRKKRRFRHGSSNPERQEYYDRTIVKVHNELGRLKNGQIPDDDQNDYGSSINFGSHASDQEDEIIGSGSVAAVRNGAKADTRSLSSTTSAVAAVNAGTGASSGNKREKRKLTLRLGGIDAERNSGNSSDETIDEPIVSGSRGKNADHGRTHTDSAHQNTLRSSPVSTQSPHQPPRNLPAAPQDQASASQNHQSHSEKSNPPALQQNKRSVLRVRAFKEVSKTPPSGPGAGGFPLSAGPRANPPLSALEHSQRIAAASVSMPEEQVKMIKETHEMMKAQNDMLKSVHSMIKDLAVNPSRHAQQALSTISNLSALVSNGVNGDSADASDSVVVANPGPSSAKDNNGANTGIGISGTNGVLALPSGTALPKPAPELISNGSAAPSAPKPFSIATELQLPKSAAASPKLPPINAFASGKPQLGPSMLRGVAQTPSQSPARTPVASRPLSADPGLEDGELEEMKDNIIYLIKAVNIPQILSDMISNTADPTMSSNSGGSRPVSPTSSASDSKPLPPQLKAMVANLRPIGALSKDNVHEYLKVLVNSMKDVRSKHV